MKNLLLTAVLTFPLSLWSQEGKAPGRATELHRNHTGQNNKGGSRPKEFSAEDYRLMKGPTTKDQERAQRLDQEVELLYDILKLTLPFVSPKYQDNAMEHNFAKALSYAQNNGELFRINEKKVALSKEEIKEWVKSGYIGLDTDFYKFPTAGSREAAERVLISQIARVNALAAQAP